MSNLTLEDLEERISNLEATLSSLADAHVEKTDPSENKLSMVIFSGTLDKMLAAMNIATGAAALGFDVGLFFTFWGTPALRKGGFKGKRSFWSRMFGWMLPSGHKHLKLSTMNMGGLGTAIIKKRMRDKRFSDLDQLFDMAKELDVRILVCDMSMDLMGMKMDDLIDYPNMAQCGVSTFMAEAAESKVTLFI